MTYTKRPKGSVREAPKKGKCQSCKRRRGVAQSIPHHGGMPILCDKCSMLRRARIMRNMNMTAARIEAILGSVAADRAARYGGVVAE